MASFGGPDDDSALQQAIMASLACASNAQPSAVSVAARECCQPGVAPPEMLRTLRKLLSNAVDNPDPKFRRLRTTNARIAAILAVPSCRRALEVVGFAPDGTGDAPSAAEAEAEAEATTDSFLVLPSTDAATAAARECLEHLNPSSAATTSTTTTAPTAAPPPQPSVAASLGRRPSSCGLCGRGVRTHGWPPRGMMFMRARAPWEGVQCDTCWANGAPWFVICGECYNDSRYASGPHLSHAWSPIGYGPADEAEGGDSVGWGSGGNRGRGRSARPPGRPGHRPGRR